jgi:hypothetical protein
MLSDRQMYCVLNSILKNSNFDSFDHSVQLFWNYLVSGTEFPHVSIRFFRRTSLGTDLIYLVHLRKAERPTSTDSLKLPSGILFTLSLVSSGIDEFTFTCLDSHDGTSRDGVVQNEHNLPRHFQDRKKRLDQAVS